MKRNDTVMPVPLAVTLYQPVAGKWTKVQIPKKHVFSMQYYGYDIHVPRRAMRIWLEECCEGCYRLNVYGDKLAVYFEHDMMAVQFKLAFEYE